MDLANRSPTISYDIHPSSKRDERYRLASYALKNNYQSNQIKSGRFFKTFSVNEDIVKVFFDHIRKGLVLDKNEISRFGITAEDNKYFKTNVVNQNDYLEVFSENVSSPVLIKYAWLDTSSASLFNSVDFPASFFNSENE